MEALKCFQPSTSGFDLNRAGHKNKQPLFSQIFFALGQKRQIPFGELLMGGDYIQLSGAKEFIREYFA